MTDSLGVHWNSSWIPAKITSKSVTEDDLGYLKTYRTERTTHEYQKFPNRAKASNVCRHICELNNNQTWTGQYSFEGKVAFCHCRYDAIPTMNILVQ